MVVDLQHLEEVCRSEVNPIFNTLLKNVLYAEFRGGSESVSGFLRDGYSWERVGVGAASNAQNYIKRLDLVRQVMHPQKHEFIALFEFCLYAVDRMLQAVDKHGWYSGDPRELRDIDQGLQRVAQNDLEYIERVFPRSGLKQVLKPDRTLSYVGLQTADCLQKYVNSWQNVTHTHIEYLMRVDGTLHLLVNAMMGMEQRRRHNTETEFTAKEVNRNYLLFVRNMCGGRESPPNILIDNGSLSVVNGHIDFNPDVEGKGRRRDPSNGRQYPYVYITNAYPQESKNEKSAAQKNAFIHVCLAYNLFGLTEEWFRDYADVRWDQITWETNDMYKSIFEDDEYAHRMSITLKTFMNLQYDLQIAFRESANPEAVVPELSYGGFNESAQAWAGNVERGKLSTKQMGFDTSSEADPDYGTYESNFPRADEGFERGNVNFPAPEPGYRYGDEDEDNNTLMYALAVGAVGGLILYSRA